MNRTLHSSTLVVHRIYARKFSVHSNHSFFKHSLKFCPQESIEALLSHVEKFGQGVKLLNKSQLRMCEFQHLDDSKPHLCPGNSDECFAGNKVFSTMVHFASY